MWFQCVWLNCYATMLQCKQHILNNNKRPPNNTEQLRKRWKRKILHWLWVKRDLFWFLSSSLSTICVSFFCTGFQIFFQVDGLLFLFIFAYISLSRSLCFTSHFRKWIIWEDIEKTFSKKYASKSSLDYALACLSPKR